MNKETAKSYAQFILIIVFLCGIYVLNFGLQLLKTDPKINNQSSNIPTVSKITLNALEKKISFEDTAQIAVRSYVPIIPEITGRIISVADNFKEGSCFEANQILFKIDTDDVKANYDTAKADQEQAQANLELTLAEAKAAMSEWQLLNSNQPIPDLVARKPQIKQARATLKAAIARMKLAQINLRDARFSYPFSGCVERSNVELGQFATIGQTLGQVFSYQALEIIVNIDAQKAARLKEIPHRVTLLLNETQYGADIDRISDIVDTTTQFAKIFLKPKNFQNLHPNQIATVIFETQENFKVFKLKDSDLIDDKFIRTLKNDNRIHIQDVDILGREDNFVYIKADQASIELVRNAYNDLAEGTQVQVISENNSNTP